MVQEFLQRELALNKVKTVGIIDLHTGLGKSGDDILIFHTPATEEDGISVLKESTNDQINRLTTQSGTQNADGSGGYEHVVGCIPEGMAKLFPKATKILPITQEFGTVPSILVFQALRRELAMFTHDPMHRMASAQAVRDVFYLRQNRYWKYRVVTQGQALYEEVLKYIIAYDAA